VQDRRGFSFNRLLERDEEKYRIYVTSDIRGREVARFVTRFLPPADGARILDVGCGSGLLAFAMCEQYGSVVGGDIQLENIALTQQGADERGITNLRLAALNALHLPFADRAFDAIVVNGVLEWLGLNTTGEDPVRRQQRAIAEFRRVVRPGGWIYLGIENRAALRNLLIDPHMRKPLLSALPRRIADWWSRRVYGRPFQAFIHTPAQLKRLLREGGFADLRLFAPVPTYQYPFHYVSLESRAQALADVDSMDRLAMQELLDRSPMKLQATSLAAKLERRSRWGMLKLTSLDLVCIGRAH
jgi:ubiquinone/menaquinone biosynthesis C-methylase UbiE